MRSIRRWLLGYLLLLLAVALGAVGVLVDRMASAAMRAREASSVERIEKTYELREQEAKSRAAEAKRKFDADLLAEVKHRAMIVQARMASILGQNLEPPRRLSPMEWTAVQIGAAVRGKNVGPRQPNPPRFPEAEPPVRTTDEEARIFRLRVALMELVLPPAGLAGPVAVAALEPRTASGPGGTPAWADPRMFNDPHRYNPFPGWIEYESPRLIDRVEDALRRAYEDDDRVTGFQITLVAGPTPQADAPVRVAYPARIGDDRVELPLAPEWFRATRETEPQIDVVEVPGKGAYRRVTTATTSNGRQLSFSVWLPPPPHIPPPANPPVRPVPRGPHVYFRVFVQIARPVPTFDDGLEPAREKRDAETSQVREETRMELAQFRGLILIGAGAFAALVLGGWLIVNRGFAPLRTLSDAVSRVSEKDFRLPVVPSELCRELEPIHARLTQTLTLLQRAFAREKQAVADISHELRTPIASLLATIDVALRKPRTTDQYRATLEECRLISKQLGQLVERIMTLASLDAGNDHGNVTRVDAAELGAECATVIRPLAAANSLALTTRLDADVALRTDAPKLREVLMNLLHNAVEYNRPDGTIELVVRRAGGAAVFEVRDTGIGMTPEVQERIFERFFRADASRTATGVHAGLGLAIVKEYVARLNGSIAVESVPGAGTTFRVTLPAPVEDAVPPAPSPNRPAARRAVPTAS